MEQWHGVTDAQPYDSGIGHAETHNVLPWRHHVPAGQLGLPVCMGSQWLHGPAIPSEQVGVDTEHVPVVHVEDPPQGVPPQAPLVHFHLAVAL